jgi:ABC-type transport system involved in cytochrome c biogenesis permease subunit
MKRRFLFALFALMLVVCGAIRPVDAKIPVEHLGAFAALPILHEGRIKPLDSFARLHYRAVTGADGSRAEALEWLATLLFDPATAMGQKIFRLPHADWVHRLGLQPEKTEHYALEDLIAAFLRQQTEINRLLTSDPKKLTADGREILRFFATVDDARQYSGALSLILPITMKLPPKAYRDLDLPADQPLDVLQLLRLKPDITASLQQLLAAKGEDLARYTEEEQQTAELAYQLRLLESIGENNQLFRVLPSPWSEDKNWYAPWEMQRLSLMAPAIKPALQAWQNAAKAWREGQLQEWGQAVATLQNYALTARPQEVRPLALWLEITKNRYDPVLLSLALLSLWGILGLLRGAKGNKFVSVLDRSRLLALIGATVILGCGIAARMVILLRPPVSTLYESILFVGFASLVLGLLLARKRRDGTMIGAVIAILLLVASLAFGPDGDHLVMLTAVLNTNFWLATHVVCITLGYAAALVAGVMAHLILWRQGGATVPANNRDEGLRLTALVALLFTSVGTMLGGIWADQSWGRFWGWDPKENGALLIVLWLIWLLHSRLAGQLRAHAFAAGMSAIVIIVALAWFGVNLLGVGLHSYGFTDHAAWSLGIFCLMDLGLILYLWRRAILFGKLQKRAVTGCDLREN